MYRTYPEYYLGSYLPPADSYTEFPKLEWAYYGCLCSKTYCALLKKHKPEQWILSILICGKQSKAHLRAHKGNMDIHKKRTIKHTIENLIKPGAEQKVSR